MTARSVISGPRRVTRRSLLTAGAATAAGVVGIDAVGGLSGTAAALDVDGPITASSLGTVIRIHADGSLDIRRKADSRVVDQDAAELSTVVGERVLDQPDESTVRLSDPYPSAAETWDDGYEVVLVEEYDQGTWKVTDLQHLYRPFDHAAVLERRDSTLVTDAGELELTKDSQARVDEERGYEAVPLKDIKEGDVVVGLGYLNSDQSRLIVAQIGTRVSG